MAGWRCKRVSGREGVREGGREGGREGVEIMRPHLWRLPLIPSIFFKEQVCLGHLSLLLLDVLCFAENCASSCSPASDPRVKLAS